MNVYERPYVDAPWSHPRKPCGWLVGCLVFVALKGNQTENRSHFGGPLKTCVVLWDVGMQEFPHYYRGTGRHHRQVKNSSIGRQQFPLPEEQYAASGLLVGWWPEMVSHVAINYKQRNSGTAQKVSELLSQLGVAAGIVCQMLPFSLCPPSFHRAGPSFANAVSFESLRFRHNRLAVPFGERDAGAQCWDTQELQDESLTEWVCLKIGPPQNGKKLQQGNRKLTQANTGLEYGIVSSWVQPQNGWCHLGSLQNTKRASILSQDSDSYEPEQSVLELCFEPEVDVFVSCCDTGV